MGYGTLITPGLEEPARSLGTAGTEAAAEELRAVWQSQQMVLKPFMSTLSPGISPRVPVRLPGTCGGTPPAAASLPHVLSGALQRGHELSIAGAGTLGQPAPPEPHSAMEQGGSVPNSPTQSWRGTGGAGGSGQGAAGALLSWHAPCRVSVCSLLRASNCSSSSRSFLFSTWEERR